MMNQCHQLKASGCTLSFVSDSKASARPICSTSALSSKRGCCAFLKQAILRSKKSRLATCSGCKNNRSRTSDEARTPRTERPPSRFARDCAGDVPGPGASGGPRLDPWRVCTRFRRDSSSLAKEPARDAIAPRHSAECHHFFTRPPPSSHGQTTSTRGHEIVFLDCRVAREDE
jgi:hypothetical protein